MKNYLQPGRTMSFTAAAAFASGAVVAIGNVLGVAAGDVAQGAQGELALDGVFTVPKVTGAVIAKGESVTWDASAGAFDDNLATPAAGDITGAAAFAFEAAGNGATTVAIRFTGVPGTRT